MNALRSRLKVCIWETRFSLVSVYLGKIRHRMGEGNGRLGTFHNTETSLTSVSGVSASVKHAVWDDSWLD